MVMPRLPKMRARGFVALVVAGVLMASAVLSNAPSNAQGFTCVPLFLNCADCNAQFPPTFGCTAPIPSLWTNGNCFFGGIACSFNLNYSCGQELLCFNQTFTGFDCLQNLPICRPF